MSEAKISDFRRKSGQVKDKRRQIRGYEQIDIGTDLDSTITIRVNSGLKARFEQICKSNHGDISRELKRYMSEVVKMGELI